MNVSIAAKELDRGDGVCKHLKNQKCEIYEERPKICRVKKENSTDLELAMACDFIRNYTLKNRIPSLLNPKFNLL